MAFNHQPMWEDLDLAAPAGEVFDRPPTDRYWRQLEREHGWSKPNWVRRPVPRPSDAAGLGALARALSGVMPTGLVPFGVALNFRSLPIISVLRDYDFVLVAGPSAGSAYLAARPYAVITMGWDIFTLPFMASSRNPVRRARGQLQRAALASSVRILGLPSVDLPYLRRLRLEHHFQAFPVPVDVDGYAAVDARTRASVFGTELAERMAGRVVFFCPSRLSFREKRQDILLQAFGEIRRQGVPALLVMLGWGHETARARALIKELGLADDVALLPLVMSKRRLVRAFKLTDVAVDQFATGAYGGIAREALASGAPLISSYDPLAAQPHPPDDPAPIFSGNTVETVRDAMLRVVDPAVRVTAGREGIAWARRHHQDAPLTEVDRLLAEI